MRTTQRTGSPTLSGARAWGLLGLLVLCGPESARASALANPAVPAAEKAPPPIFHASEVAPYFAAGPLAQAKQAFDEGRYADAFSALGGQAQSPPTRYLEALCLLRSGRPAEAGPRFAALAAEELPLADRCHFHAAVAYEDAGNLAAAEQEYGAVAQGSVVWADARLGLARVQRRRGNLLGALEAVAALANGPSGSAGRDMAAEALYVVAEISAARKDCASAILADLELWSEHPLANIADAALLQAKGLGLLEPPVAIKLVRAEMLEESQRNLASMRLLRPLVASLPFPSPMGCKARFLLGKALRKERLYPRALAELAPVVERCASEPAVHARALYVAASAASIVKPEQGIAYYEQLARQYPDHSFADDALFFAADLYQRAGRTGEAVGALARLTTAPAYRDSDYRPDGLFRLFWIHRGRGELDDGLGILKQIAEEHGQDRPAEAERAAYWRGRTLLDLGREQDALDAFEQLARTHPASYYGLLARSRLAERAPARAQALVRDLARLPSPAEDAFHLGGLEGEPHFLAAAELLRLGLDDAAAEELLAIRRSDLRGGNDLDPQRLLVTLLARAGSARAAQAIARTDLQQDLAGPLTSESLAVWQAAYPLAYRNGIERSCAPARVKPDLLQALIREESALDPHARSWAGAVGLTQLMVPTAKALARSLGLHVRINAGALEDPDLNLQLGSAYVGRLLERFDGNPALALAAYNAGAGAVGAWLRDRGGEPLDAFVEEIPIAETRNYVKRVLQTFTTYQLLYTKSAEATLPQWCAASNSAGTPSVPRRAGVACASERTCEP